MTSILSNILFSSEARKLLIYYFIYCVFFLLFYLALVSTISFFHFLLDHEMGIIENWLNQNSWEILITSKLGSAILTLKSLMLNNYQLKSFRAFFKQTLHLPKRKNLVFVLFIIIILYALLNQFGSELIRRDGEYSFSLTSYLGASFFYLIDVVVIFYCLIHMEITLRQTLILNLILPLFFYVTTKIALPYVDKYTIFIFLHIITLNIFMFKDRDNFSNCILYAFGVIGPLSALLGIDLVWDNSYAIYSFPKTVPIIGIILIWLTAIIYYLKKS